MPVGSQVLARHRKVSWSVSSCTHCEHNIPDLIDCDLSIHDTIKVCVCVCVCPPVRASKSMAHYQGAQKICRGQQT